MSVLDHDTPSLYCNIVPHHCTASLYRMINNREQDQAAPGSVAAPKPCRVERPAECNLLTDTRYGCKGCECDWCEDCEVCSQGLVVRASLGMMSLWGGCPEPEPWVGKTHNVEKAYCGSSQLPPHGSTQAAKETSCPAAWSASSCRTTGSHLPRHSRPSGERLAPHTCSYYGVSIIKCWDPPVPHISQPHIAVAVSPLRFT